MMRYVLVFFLIFVGLAQAAPYLESQYRSLYQTPQTIFYIDQYGVQKTQTRVGFRYQNDLTDSIIVCQKENNPCNAQNRRWTLHAGFQDAVTLSKVFITPGTTSVSFNAFVGQGTGLQYFAIARLGQPPQTDNRYQPNTVEFNNLPSLGFNLQQLRTKDCIGKHSNGILSIVNDSGKGIVTEQDGAWLYIIVIALNGNIISGVYDADIDTNTYLNWFTTKTLNNTWNTLNEQSYINAPTEPYTPVIVPQPTPYPVTDLGCDMYTCNGHCVAGVCVPFTPPSPTPISCDVLMCYLSGGSCINNVCVNKNSPIPTPTPVPKKKMSMNILDTPIIIDMQPSSDANESGTADVSVGEFLYPGIEYSIK